MSTKEEVTFRATIPTLQSAITFAGDGGMRVKLDIPMSEEGAALPLLTMRERVLVVTVRLEEQG